MAKKGDAEEGAEEDEDDELDKEDAEMIKEENRSEYDLQLSISEIVGVIFKTHKHLVANLLEVLFTSVLPAALATNVKDKTKFTLFILDDMIEYLGPDVLQARFGDVASRVISFCDNQDAAIRQAASYGVGMLAQHGGAAYASINAMCL